MSIVPAQDQQKLEVGSEVLFNVTTDARRNESVISLAILPAGSLQERQTSSSKLPRSALHPVLFLKLPESPSILLLTS